MTAVLVNAGETPFAARTFAADAFTAVNGGMGLDEDGSRPTGPTTWISYPAETLTIDTNAAVQRRFTVSVPNDTAPGQYISGIVLQTAEPLAIDGSTMFTQILRKTVAVFITVPGPVIPELEIGAVQLAVSETGSTVTVDLANTGNVLLRPTGSIVLHDASGDAVITVPVAMGSVYAGHTTAIEIALPAPLPPGALTVDVDLADAAHKLSVASHGTVVTASAAAAQEAPSPLTLAETVIAAMPSPDAVQYLDIATRITNAGDAVSSGRLSLRVHRDRTLVESFPLASPLSVATGTTDVAQRYIPVGGWVPGVYDFALTLESVDPATGVASLLAKATVVGTLTIR